MSAREPAADADDPAALLRGADAVEAVQEGYRLHYATSRTVPAGDRDFALLAGDRLYALGLERLARAGELGAIEILCDTIAACARAHAEGDPGQARRAWRDATRQLSVSRRARLS